MAVTGWKYPTSTVEQSDGNNAWFSAASVNQFQAEDTTCAVNTGVPSGGGLTNRVFATTFGFTSADVPSGATIDGIEAVLEGISNRTSGSYDQINLLGVTGTPSAKAGGSLPTGSTCVDATEQVFGGSTDVWSASPTQSDVTSSGFGISIRLQNGHPSQNATFRCDYVRVRIYYTAGTLYHATATAAATATATAAARRIRHATVTAAASTTATAAARRIRHATATAAASATATAAARRIRHATATASASATATALGAKLPKLGTATAASSATCTAIGRRFRSRSATVGSEATLTCAARRIRHATAAAATEASMTAAARRTRHATATAAASATMTAVVPALKLASATAAASATMTVKGLAYRKLVPVGGALRFYCDGAGEIYNF